MSETWHELPLPSSTLGPSGRSAPNSLFLKFQDRKIKTNSLLHGWSFQALLLILFYFQFSHCESQTSSPPSDSVCGVFLSSTHLIYHSSLSYSCLTFHFLTGYNVTFDSTHLYLWCLAHSMRLVSVYQMNKPTSPSAEHQHFCFQSTWPRAETSPSKFSLWWNICSPLFSPLDLPSESHFVDRQLKPKRGSLDKSRRGECQQRLSVICGMEF